MLSAENPTAEHKIPEQVVAAWKEAVASKSKGTKNALFQAFLSSGKDWAKLHGRNLLHTCFFIHLYSFN